MNLFSPARSALEPSIRRVTFTPEVRRRHVLVNDSVIEWRVRDEDAENARPEDCGKVRVLNIKPLKRLQACLTALLNISSLTDAPCLRRGGGGGRRVRVGGG